MLPQKNNQQLTFKKGERLKSRKTIQTLFIQNKHLRIYPFKLVYTLEPSVDEYNLKMGVSVSKRFFKSAVQRNLIKRKMRECLRLNKMLLNEQLENKNNTLSFMLIYLDSRVLSYNEFNTKIKQLLIRLGDKLNNE